MVRRGRPVKDRGLRKPRSFGRAVNSVGRGRIFLSGTPNLQQWSEPRVGRRWQGNDITLSAPRAILRVETYGIETEGHGAGLRLRSGACSHLPGGRGRRTLVEFPLPREAAEDDHQVW